MSVPDQSAIALTPGDGQTVFRSEVFSSVRTPFVLIVVGMGLSPSLQRDMLCWRKEVSGLDYRDDICPIMSIGKDLTVNCTEKCAWFDTERLECALSVINGSLKNLRPEDHTVETM